MSLPNQEQLAAAEAIWDVVRGAETATPEEEDALMDALGDNQDLINRLLDSIYQLYTETDFDREDLPVTWWLDAESWRSAGNSGGLTSSDLAGFRSLPDSIAAAARAGTAQGVSGIKVVLDGYTVGQLVAPYVSESIARDVIL